MMRKIILSFLLLLHTAWLYAQADSVKVKNLLLNEVIITPYEIQNSSNIPSATAGISVRDMARFSNSSVLPAVNNIPGVKMEERSPGSYRLGIRGSNAAAPFGVRNTKVYYNGIPYTDAGGNTYLNQLGYYNIQSLEVVREPGSSLYGAGIGGVVFINSLPQQWSRKVVLHYTGGSYGLMNIAAEVAAGTEKFQNTIRYQQLNADGYRQHSRLQKDVYSWDGLLRINNRSRLNIHALYGRLNYETPGGLTQAQYIADERQARPGAGAIPGAEQNRAAVNQEALLAGITYSYRLHANWENITTLYGRFTRLDNPTIRNYSKVYQPGFGGRSSLKYVSNRGGTLWQYVLGAEVQQGNSFEKTYRNISGTADTLQQQHDINNLNSSVFTQLALGYKRWLFVAGASYNMLRVDVASQRPVYINTRSLFNNEIAPRIGVSYTIATGAVLYASVSKGYTPPATEELAPTGSAVNLSLKPAHGWNYQAGLKGKLWKVLHYDIVGFHTVLQDIIVQRRDAAGGDYYINAGSAEQTGIEASLKYDMMKDTARIIKELYAFASYTGYHFRYGRFVQVANDYSGNKMPGIAPATVAAGFHVSTVKNIYADVNCYYSDIIPLDDANSISAGSYTLLDARVGVMLYYRKHTANIFAGANNLLNQRYSLGNDINAVGGRYFNAAPGINFFAGLSVNIGY